MSDSPATTFAATRWTPAEVRAIAEAPLPSTPLISAEQVVPVAPELGIWDAWPLQNVDGTVADFPGGRSLWFALGAPRFDDPDDRHHHARIHLIERCGQSWRDLGPAMPEGFAPGSREWSGSAIVDANSSTVTLHFTAAGRRAESRPSFEQRLFAADASLGDGAGGLRLDDWRALRETVARDPRWYMASDAGSGTPGAIKAFRDPAYFRDPADGMHYLFFAASCADADSTFNGAVGVACAEPGDAGQWRILPPLIDATGLNNELERPHVVAHAGLYYLFWSTQAHVFDPAGPRGPTGLYGMASNRVTGGWQPLNGTGLVFANPPEAPRQAYSWLVLPDLSVTSFADAWGEPGEADTPARFGGSFAPWLRLRLDGFHAALS